MRPPRLARLVSGLALGLMTLLLVPRPAASSVALSFVPNAVGFEDNATDAFSNAGVAAANPSYSLGYEFTVAGPITVTSLGYFNDPGYAGPTFSEPLNPEPAGSYAFADSHDVGIYDTSGTLLLSGTVPQTGGTPLGDFVYTSALTGLPVLPTGTYVIAGVTGGTDPYVYSVQTADGNNFGITTDSAIGYVQDQYAVSPTLVYPAANDPGSEPGFFGPNFQFTADAAAAPEPPQWGTLALLGLGLGGLCLRAHRRSGACASAPLTHKETNQ